MKRMLFLLAVILWCGGGVYAQGHQVTDVPAPSSLTWFSYTSAEGRYTVKFGGEPKLSTQDITTVSGDKLTQYMAGSPIGEVGYLMVGYFDYPSTSTFSLDEARNGMVDALKGTLLGEEAISLGGAPGRAIKLSAKTGSGTEFIDRARFYDVNRRIYVVQCLFPASEPDANAARICDQFFDSLRVRANP